MDTTLQASADNRTLDIAIDGSFTAAQVEALIRQLAMARAGLLPAVPAQNTSTPEGGQPRLVEDATSIVIERPQADGQVVWNLRSEGLGWVAWRLHPDHVAGWVKYLAAYHQTQIPAPAANQNSRH